MLSQYLTTISFLTKTSNYLYTYLDKSPSWPDQRRVYVITIPTAKDFDAAKKSGGDFELIRKLQTFAEQARNVTIVDLAPYFLSNAAEFGRTYQDYTFTCDRHWGPLGNRVAADALLKTIYGLPASSD